jgi:hypothetical protein
MIFLYTSLLFLLGLVKALWRLRARSLERTYIRVAAAVDHLVRQGEQKPGNGRGDPCVSAKRAYFLGQLVQRRDRIEAKHFAWQRGVERLTRWTGALRGWKGKTLPYTVGAADIWMLLHLIDYLGVGQYVSAGSLLQLVGSWFTS